MLPFRIFAAAAVSAATFAITAPGFATDAYQDTLAACRKNAEASEVPTDFKCNWKAVVRGAPGSALSGKYKFREQGMGGLLTVLEGDGLVLVALDVVTLDANAATCSADLTGARNDNDELVVKLGEEEDQDCVVTIKSIPGPNLVEVSATEACNTFCGVRAGFTGQWQLQSK